MREVKNEKGFRVLSVSRSELEKATCQTHCCCDSCLATPEFGYYVAVLNMWFCPKCYEHWMTTATRYLEDSIVEERNYLKYKTLLER